MATSAVASPGGAGSDSAFCAGFGVAGVGFEGRTGDGSVTSAIAICGFVSSSGDGGAGLLQPGSPTSGTMVYELLHLGQLAVAPAAWSGARTPPARQYGQVATIAMRTPTRGNDHRDVLGEAA